MVSPMQDQIAYNEKQSHTLATIRDVLLPKLMSGEILARIEPAMNAQIVFYTELAFNIMNCGSFD